MHFVFAAHFENGKYIASWSDDDGIIVTSAATKAELEAGIPDAIRTHVRAQSLNFEIHY